MKLKVFCGDDIKEGKEKLNWLGGEGRERREIMNRPLKELGELSKLWEREYIENIGRGYIGDGVLHMEASMHLDTLAEYTCSYTS